MRAMIHRGLLGGLLAVLALFLVLGAAGEARAQRAFEPLPPPRLPESEAAAIAAQGFAPKDVGFLVQDLDSGEILAARNAADAFIPASVIKLATAVAALEILGGDHRFETRVATQGRLREGTLHGDLVLIGGGDPLLGADDLLALCHELRAEGIRTVSGRFLYDDSHYTSRPVIEAGQPLDAGYNPGVSALSLEFNRVRLRWRAAHSIAESSGNGVVPRAGHSIPPLPGLALEVAAEHPGGNQIWVPRDGDGLTFWQLSPRAGAEGASWLPLRDPARVAAQTFRRLCAQAGVRLPRPEAGTAPPDSRTAARQESPQLTEVVQGMLAYSNNLVAELTGLAAARGLTGRAQDLPESADTLAQWWRQSLPEVDWSSYAAVNHSGLSPQTRLTPAQAVAILVAADGRFYAGGGGRRSLESLAPAAGLHGSLAGRLDGEATGLKVWAKTGTINYASGLAGYLHAEGGSRLAFSLFVNDKAARSAYDRNPNRRAARVRAEAAGWRTRAKRLENILVESWSQRW